MAGVLGFEPRNGGIKILMRTNAMRMTTKTKAATQDCRCAGYRAGFISGCRYTDTHAETLMRFKNGLALFQKTNSPWHWNIASFHSPHSLTWSWILSFSVFKSDEGRWWPLFWSYRTNQGPHWGLRFPPFGLLTWQQQQPMWYRDLFIRRRDEAERLRSERNALERTIRPYTGPGLKVVTADPKTETET